MITLSGIGQIAALWHRELNDLAIIDALIGAVYLIIGLGLFGQSRFTLFMAIVIPTAAAAYFAGTYPGTSQLYIARIAVDGIVASASLLVLWSVRKNPSV